MLLGMGILMLGAGLQGTLIGVRATLEDFPTYVTGLVMSCYYLGYLGGTSVTSRLVQRVGHVRVFAALTALAAVSILIQGAFVEPLLWAIVRGASGFCFAGIYVVAESWLNDRATNSNRGTLLSAYMVILYGGLGAGQFLLVLADPAGPHLFMLVAALVCLALVPITLSVQRAPEVDVPQHIGLAELYRASPLGVAGVGLGGMISGTLFSIGPVFAQLTGLASEGIAAFMAFSIFAAVLTQLPIGRWSDRVDRRNVLVTVCMLAALAALGAMLVTHHSTAALLAFATLFGGLALTLYSLALSHVNDHLRPAQMVAASSSMILLNGAGAALGPVAVAILMNALGPSAYFASLAVLCATLGGYGMWRKHRRASVPSGEKVHFVAAQPQAVAGQMVGEATATQQEAETP